MSRRNTAIAGLLGLLVLVTLAGCGWFGSDGSKKSTKSTSVFTVKPGECFQAPKDVKTELSNLARIDCSQPHTQESYAIVTYANVDGSDPSVYPGSDLLTKFAQGKCAQSFGSYVGVSYLDSKLYFTYLFPSARGWEQDKDRNVICFVTTTGAQLTESVKGTKQ
jgi:hypothetical protein